jgi:hypothetical protein
MMKGRRRFAVLSMTCLVGWCREQVSGAAGNGDKFAVALA